jgi:hypothetical protein
MIFEFEDINGKDGAGSAIGLCLLVESEFDLVHRRDALVGEGDVLDELV